MASPIPDLILGGACDEDLDSIYEAAKARRELVAEQRALNLKPGDEFYVRNISPKLLERARVKFVSHDDRGLRVILQEYCGTNYPVGKVLLLRRSHVGQVLNPEGTF